MQIRTCGGRKQELRDLCVKTYSRARSFRRGEHDTDEPYAGRCFLHLTEMVLVHPTTGRSLGLSAPAPTSFKAAAMERDLLEDSLIVALNARLGCLARRRH